MTIPCTTLIALLSTLTMAKAFQGVATPHDFRAARGASTLTTSTTRARQTIPTTALGALIYGWDDANDDDESQKQQKPSYTATSVFDNELDQCPQEGVAMAESLSLDTDRVGSLARLAVAFAPPDQALQLDQIEKVDVICVTQDHIDIQVVLCEDAGCVSLAVPVRFPSACDPNGLQGCVIQNLDDLDTSAQSDLMKQKRQSSMGGESLDQPVTEYPSWWIRPSFDLEGECIAMRNILNEVEFAPDIRALAQSALNHAEAGGLASSYQVQNARVAAVGPAGLAFKAQAMTGGFPVVLDVLFKFPETMGTVETLRAAVLGAVAEAEGF